MQLIAVKCKRVSVAAPTALTNHKPSLMFSTYFFPINIQFKLTKVLLIRMLSRYNDACNHYLTIILLRYCIIFVNYLFINC